MDTNDIKKEVQSYIINGVKNITNDSRSFLFLRIIHTDDINNKELNIGGGNLLIAMGNFTIFEYLAKIYYGLTNDVVKWFDCETFMKPADQCFFNLIHDNNSGVSFGIEKLSSYELTELWKEWRNKLSHLLRQKEKHSSISLFFSFAEGINQRQGYLDFIDSKLINQSAFIKNNSGWQCFIDILNRDLDKLANWIANDVLNNSKEENINKIYTWLITELR